jgi:TRAP-type C4-dicarboxylate transport system permease small subunit
LELAFAAALGFFALAIAFYQVVTRYAFGYSPSWALEVIIYAITWAVFIMASILLKERRHVGVQFVLDHLPARTRYLTEISVSIVGLCFCVFLARYGLAVAMRAKSLELTSTTALAFPLWVVRMSIVVGASLLVFRFLQQIHCLVQSRKAEDATYQHEDMQ